MIFLVMYDFIVGWSRIFFKVTSPLCHLLQKKMCFLSSIIIFGSIIVWENVWSKPFELMCDSSDYAVGEVLRQYIGSYFMPFITLPGCLMGPWDVSNQLGRKIIE